MAEPEVPPAPTPMPGFAPSRGNLDRSIMLVAAATFDVPRPASSEPVLVSPEVSSPTESLLATVEEPADVIKPEPPRLSSPSPSPALVGPEGATAEPAAEPEPPAPPTGLVPGAGEGHAESPAPATGVA